VTERVTSQGKQQDSVFEINLQIWDTVGQEAYRSINRLYYKGCAACVLVYDLSKPHTLNLLEEWLLEFLDNFQDPET
jgi:Ras-related protein Rab-2A